MAARPNIEMYVLPLARGEHDGLDGGYVTMDFAKAPTIVYLEHKRSSQFLDKPELVAPYVDATKRLLDMVLSQADSIRFIAELAERQG